MRRQSGLGSDNSGKMTRQYKAPARIVGPVSSLPGLREPRSLLYVHVAFMPDEDFDLTSLADYLHLDLRR